MYHLLLALHPEITLGLRIGRGMPAAQEVEAQTDLGDNTITTMAATTTAIITPGIAARATGLGPHVDRHVGITANPSPGPTVDSCIAAACARLASLAT